jgi:hypothetical protein
MNLRTSAKAAWLATAFTGIAAALVAFAPTAMAAPRHSVESTSIAGPRTIHESPCGDGTRNWVHIGTGGTSDVCFGGIGAAYNLGIPIFKYCGGNNFGYLRVANSSGATKKVPFKQGTHYTDPPSGYNNLLTVRIKGYRGHDGCGLP